MSSYFVSVKVSNKEWETFKVPKAVYTYIKQLEAYVRNTSLDVLLKLYPNLKSNCK